MLLSFSPDTDSRGALLCDGLYTPAMAQVIIHLPSLLSKYHMSVFEESGFLGHSPGVRLSLLDLNHVTGLKGMVIPGGGAVQYQVNNYLQAVWIQVSAIFLSMVTLW